MKFINTKQIEFICKTKTNKCNFHTSSKQNFFSIKLALEFYKYSMFFLPVIFSQ